MDDFKPTMKLRWVESPNNPMIVHIPISENTSKSEHFYFRLQQLWTKETVELKYEICKTTKVEQWRDIDVVEEDKMIKE